jgi:hypothetical protein
MTGVSEMTGGDDKGPMHDPRSTRDVLKAAPPPPLPEEGEPEPTPPPAGAATYTVKPDQEDA